MVAEWRRQWSAVPGTTAADAPFGVVTLAAGGSEGHDNKMAGMRWSQTGNYGTVRVFGQKIALEDAIAFHAFAPLEASIRATNAFLSGVHCLLLVPP
jgi:hypothetical protein